MKVFGHTSMNTFLTQVLIGSIVFSLASSNSGLEREMIIGIGLVVMVSVLLFYLRAKETHIIGGPNLPGMVYLIISAWYAFVTQSLMPIFIVIFILGVLAPVNIGLAQWTKKREDERYGK